MPERDRARVSQLLERHDVAGRVARVVAGGVTALDAELRALDPSPEDRPIVVDLFLGELLAALALPAHLPLLLEVVAAWRGAHGFPPRGAGHLSPLRLAAAAHHADALRGCLADLVRSQPAAALDLDERGQRLLVYAWRQHFLNPVAPLVLVPGLIDADPAAGPWYPDMVVASMHRPFAAAADLDPAALWRDPELPLALKLVLSLWLVTLPELNLTPAHRARFLALAPALCRAVPPLPPDLLDELVDELMAGLFRSAYAGGPHVEALSAAGDLVADAMQRRAPDFGRPPPRPPRRSRLRLGYLVEGRVHAVSFYMVNRVLHHDPARFEVWTFSPGDRHDWMTELFVKGSDRFVRVPRDDPEALARAVTEARLDALVFAEIGMDLAPYLAAGLHLAPLQIALMGHAASTGMPTIRYYFGGDHEPPGAERHYRETLVRLPRLGAAQLAPPAAPAPSSRRDLGLPDDAVVLVNLGHGMKHLPERDALLVEILRRAPGACLLLKPYFDPTRADRSFARRLFAAAERAGVDKRIRFAPPLPRMEQVAGLLALADVQLDTYPFGGWTTNLEALHAGLPIVTQEGDHGRSRWGAGFLRALGITDGIAADAAGYVEQAVRLAEDRDLRQRLGRDIAAGASAFFDGPGAQPAYENALLTCLE